MNEKIILIIDDDIKIGDLEQEVLEQAGNDYIESIWGIGFKLGDK